MKNRKRMLLSAFIICILALFYISYIPFKSAHFTQWSHTEVSRKMFEEHEAVYLGYDFSWEGTGTPILQSISLFILSATVPMKNKKQLPFQKLFFKIRQNTDLPAFLSAVF